MTCIRLAAAVLLVLISGSALAQERSVSTDTTQSPTRVLIPQSASDGYVYEYY
jgi:hypothetical protein